MQQATNTVDPICMIESEKPIIQPQIQAPPPYKSSNLQPFDKIIDKQEDKSTKQRPQKGIIKLTVAVTLISLSSFYYGFVLTYLSTIPKSTLVKYYGDVINQTSTLPIISGAMPIGAIFGSLLANVFMRFFTRRNFLLFVSLIAIAINLIIQITNIWVLLFCRFITGILVGLFLGIVPAYINEITPSKMLGTMGAFTQMQHLLGNVISYLFGTIFYLSNFEGDFMMRFQFQFTSFLILLQFIGIGFGIVPQSPNSLLLAGRYEEARQVLSQFNYEDEIDGIINEKLFENGQNQKKPSYSEAPPEQSNQNSPLHIQSLPLNKIDDSQPKMTWKSYLLSFQLPLTQQLTGVNFIVTQVTAITALYDEKLSHFTGLIANAVQLIATSFSTILLSSFGRRPIIIVGNICVGILTLIIGVVFLLLYYGWQPGFGLGMGLIMLFNVVYGLTLGPIVWLYVPEIASKKIVPIATATYWGGCSFSLIVAPIITSIMQSPYAVFFFFGGYTTAMILPNWKLVVQTKGLTSSQISKKFKTN